MIFPELGLFFSNLHQNKLWTNGKQIHGSLRCELKVGNKFLSKKAEICLAQILQLFLSLETYNGKMSIKAQDAVS